MNFKEWLNEKYHEWISDPKVRSTSEAAYARYLGVNSQVLNYWMLGKKTPRILSSIDKLVDKYGAEVYDILGIQLTEEDRELLDWRVFLHMLTPQQRAQFNQLKNSLLANKQREEALRLQSKHK